MYQQRIEPFGACQKLIIFNEKNGIYLSLIPDYGAYITQLDLPIGDRTISVIDGYKTYEEMVNDKYYKSAILFPFPNRLADGKYTFEGKTYEFPINETDNQHAIHGFKDFYKMSVDKLTLKSDEASVRLKHAYRGEHKGFPFSVDFYITYTISDNNGFTCTLGVHNVGEQATPIGLGWHPYFKINHSSVNNWKLKLPTLYNIPLNERMLPKEEYQNFAQFSSFKEIGSLELDHSFVIEPNGQTSKVYLRPADETYELVYWQESREGKYPYIQLFIPPTRDSIAIEPMTCSVDAFNNKKGLIVLQAGEEFQGAFGVSLHDF